MAEANRAFANGEENDFCYRALEAGWRHVMCDDTFIFHAGTRSFSSEARSNDNVILFPQSCGQILDM